MLNGAVVRRRRPSHVGRVARPGRGGRGQQPATRSCLIAMTKRSGRSRRPARSRGSPATGCPVRKPDAPAETADRRPAASSTSPVGSRLTRRGTCTSPTTPTTRSARSRRPGSSPTSPGRVPSCASPPNCGDGGQATSARLNSPYGVAVDPAGDVLIADSGDDEIRSVAPNGIISRFAGTGASCASPPNCGDGGLAKNATLVGPDGVGVDHAGDVLIADTFGQEVREVLPSGTIKRIAGTGTACSAAPSCGDGAGRDVCHRVQSGRGDRRRRRRRLHRRHRRPRDSRDQLGRNHGTGRRDRRHVPTVARLWRWRSGHLGHVQPAGRTCLRPQRRSARRRLLRQ